MLKINLLDLLHSCQSSVSSSLQPPAALQSLLALCSIPGKAAEKAGRLARVALANSVGMESEDPEAVIWLEQLPKVGTCSTRQACQFSWLLESFWG